MSRARTQTTGYNRPLNGPPRTPHVAALLARARGKTIEQVHASRPLVRPHTHVFELGGCNVCGMLEVEST